VRIFGTHKNKKTKKQKNTPSEYGYTPSASAVVFVLFKFL
jgi:hypothetical protein